MIRGLVAMLARTLLELGIVLLLAGGLLLFVAYRLVRRLTVGGEDALERYSQPLASMAAAVAELAAVRKGRAS